MNYLTMITIQPYDQTSPRADNSRIYAIFSCKRKLTTKCILIFQKVACLRLVFGLSQKKKIKKDIKGQKI